MKIPRTPAVSRRKAGFSLIELSFVMFLMVSLAVGMGFGVTSVQKWKKGKNGSLALQAVYAAQRGYMADHPTADIEAVTSEQLLEYLPQGWSAMPTVPGLSGEPLTVDFTVMPPTLLSGTSVYDPSGKPDDGLWDTGG
jgi:type II secretory pathway pseudopilin PulG